MMHLHSLQSDMPWLDTGGIVEEDWEHLTRALLSGSGSDPGPGATAAQDPVRLPPCCTSCSLTLMPSRMWTPKKPLLGAFPVQL